MLNKIERILVVDDEPEFTRTVLRHLRREGYRIGTACDGRSAVDKITEAERQKHPYQLVITDMVMPNMDGIDLLNWIKNHHPMISVLILSGFGDNDAVINVIRQEMDGFGQKPLTPEDMKALIARIGQGRREKNDMETGRC